MSVCLCVSVYVCVCVSDGLCVSVYVRLCVKNFMGFWVEYSDWNEILLEYRFKIDSKIFK